MVIQESKTLTEQGIAGLQGYANRIRANAVMMTNQNRSGHVGSSLSMADIIAVLFDKILNFDPSDPKMAGRDRFILSKGHAAAGVYAAMAEKGFFPAEWLKTYYGDAGKLCGHISHHVPGVEFSTGSLGHGLPVALGMALAARKAKVKFRVIALLSDGDCNEGSTWEAFMLAAQHKVDNLTVIVDYNRVQALGMSKDVIDLEPFAEKMELFKWAAKRIDGHDHQQIYDALANLPLCKGKPSIIIADTVKCKGIGRLENTVQSHYRYIPDEELGDIYKEIGAVAGDWK